MNCEYLLFILNDIFDICITKMNQQEEYIYSKKYIEIQNDNLILEYIGENKFIDDKGKKYLYENNKMYLLDDITGEKKDDLIK